VTTLVFTFISQREPCPAIKLQNTLPACEKILKIWSSKQQSNPNRVDGQLKRFFQTIVAHPIGDHIILRALLQREAHHPNLQGMFLPVMIQALPPT
jgi:hypothetical protein